MNADRYLERLGLAPADVAARDLAALERLQRRHVLTVPFENISITGPPDADRLGEGVSLDIDHLFEKIVERERGGFCYELNGLFGSLLAELGFETYRVPARVLNDDGEARPPANHHTNVVTFDRTYVVDVGVAIPTIRQPLPLDGSVREDAAGVAWRVVESDRPDADYLAQFKSPGDDEWEGRYVFTDRPVDLDHFAATCEYLATAPESHFTSRPFATIATERGHKKLKPGTLTIMEGDETREVDVDADEWDDILRREFGLTY